MTKIKKRYKINPRRNNKQNNNRYNDRWQIVRMSFKLINFVNLNTVFFKKKHISSKYNRARDTKFRLLYKAKQEVKKFYGDITERKLKTVYKLAFKNHQSIITKLEATISTVLFRLNYVTSVYAAKQLVSHGHILINGKKMTIPSYILKTGDIIQIPNKVSEKFKTKNIQSILTGNLSPTINLKSDISPENISSKELVLNNKGLKSINLINSNLAKTITIIIRYKNLIKRPWHIGGAPQMKKGRFQNWYFIPIYLEVDYNILTAIYYQKAENINTFITKPLIRDIMHL